MTNIINCYNIKSRDYLEISSKILINTTKEKLWESLTQNQHLLYFNCFVKEQKQGLISGVGYKDNCIYYNNKKLYREVVDYQFKQRVKFKINFEGQKHNNFTLFEVIERNENVYFKLTMQSDGYKNVPRPIWHFLAYFFLVPSYKKYLNAVTKGMNYHCLTGKRVEKNQFGFHKRFTT